MEYVIPQGKVCAWNGFFAKSGDRFPSAEAMTDRDGRPIPAAVLERFVSAGCMVKLTDGRPHPAEVTE